jgi:DNA-binding MarR family transcriptional regulator
LKKTDHIEIRERARHLLTKGTAEPSMYINDLAHLFDAAVTSAVEKETLSTRGASKGYRGILHHLYKEDGITQLTLVKLTHLSAPSVSAALNNMEREGLVERRADLTDMRQVRVYLTDTGRKRHLLIKKKCRETDEVMLKGITPEEREQLCNTLKKMLLNMLE